MQVLHIIEIILIIAIVILQIVVFARVCKKIHAYEQLFSDKISVDNDLQVPMVVVNDHNGHIIQNAPIQPAVKNINSYIQNNWGGSVNFSIIENIIERESETRDEEIQHLIPTPLYMGLAATMIGIILGLFSMGRIGGDTTQDPNKPNTENQITHYTEQFTISTDSEDYLEALHDQEFAKTQSGSLDEIDNLIDGVKIAMIASLFGLLWTTLLSTWIYKKAKNNVNSSKNSTLNYLQSELLLPTEDNTLTGIRDCINQFSRNIGSTITELTALANTNSSISRQIQESTIRQETILRQIQEIKPAKVTKVLSELFDKIDANMEAYREFSRYLSLMGEISERMYSFSQRTQNIEEIANEVKSSINESRDLFHFLSEHMRGVENIGEQSLEAINAADSHFHQAVASLDREVTQRIRALSDGSNAFDSKITQIFEQIGNNLQEITRTHIDALSNAYHENLPEFKRLEKLDDLDSICEKLDGVGQIKRIEEERSEQFQSVITPLTSIERKNESKSNEIITAIKETNKRLDKIDKNTSVAQSRTTKTEADPQRPPKPRKWRRILKVVLLILAVAGIGLLTYYYAPKYIKNAKKDKDERMGVEFARVLETISNETPLLCEKYKLVSLNEPFDVPETWKEDSLRYRKQLDPFWTDDRYRQKATLAITNQKQCIIDYRKQCFHKLLANENKLFNGGFAK